MMEPEVMYRTEHTLSRPLTVVYPVEKGTIMLRTELDWSQDMAPERVSPDGHEFTFRLTAQRPFLYFKPILRNGERWRWASGPNLLALMTSPGVRQVYPLFQDCCVGSFEPRIELQSRILGRKLSAQVYLPPGYSENTLRRYPVLYMQDGRNLFFPEEAFLGQDWMVDDSLETLDQMNAMDRVIVVGVHTTEREKDYTKPGYKAYARAVVEELKPRVDAGWRTMTRPEETGVMGSSLGGVVSFYMAWEYPEVFGFAACLSSTFSLKDDLIERVLSEPRREVKFYLDSGWPGDNYEVGLAMALALSQRGYVYGQNFLHFGFPLAEHDENAWSQRLHLPLQLFTGKISAAARGRFV